MVDATFLAVAPSTGPLERSFSQLAKIDYREQNQLSSDSIYRDTILLGGLFSVEIDFEMAAKNMEA